MKTQALVKYKKSLKDASGNVIIDTSDARVNIPKTPVPSVKVSIMSPFAIWGITFFQWYMDSRAVSQLQVVFKLIAWYADYSTYTQIYYYWLLLYVYTDI